MKVLFCEDECGTVMFNCPGCGTFHGAATKRPNGSGAMWSWNGSIESPTLNPSLLVKWMKNDGVSVENMCHSFIRDGMIEFLSDSTHELSGKTVPIPTWNESD